MHEQIAFLAAAKAGDAEKLSALLGASSSPASLLTYQGAGTPDATCGNTATHWAAAKGHKITLAKLLGAGADAMALNNGDSTPLQGAVLNGHGDCARLLLGAGADPNRQDEFGDSPLSLARRAKDSELVELLSVVDVSDPPPPPPKPPDVAECKAKGNAAFARKKYDEAIGWYTDALSSGAADAETAAALHSNRSACHLALKDTELALQDGRNALEKRPGWAKANGRIGAALHGMGDLQGALEAYKAALEAEPEYAVAKEQVAALKAAIRNAKLEAMFERGTFKRQAEAEGEAHGQAAEGAAAAEPAVGEGGAPPAAASGAAAAAAKPEKPPKTEEELRYAQTVGEWMRAAKAGQIETLKRLHAEHAWLLMNRSENTEEKLLGNTALHWAASKGKCTAMDWLLCAGAEIDGLNLGASTPLHSAAAHGRESATRLLLEAGAAVAPRDDNGDTARDAAARRGYRSVEAAIDRGPISTAMRWLNESSAPLRRGGSARARPASAEEAKAAGNAAFAKASTTEGSRAALLHYTDALLLARVGRAEQKAAGILPDESGQDHYEAVIFSNRSAAHAKLGQYHAALEDAEGATQLSPEWGKAYGRKGAALLGLGHATKATAAYREGLKCEPKSVSLLEGLVEAQKRLRNADGASEQLVLAELEEAQERLAKAKAETSS